MLTGAADGIVERDRVTAPEAPVLWRQGRRATWAGRAAAAAIAAALLFLLATGGVALTGISPTVPAAGGTLTYPTVEGDRGLAGPQWGIDLRDTRWTDHAAAVGRDDAEGEDGVCACAGLA